MFFFLPKGDPGKTGEQGSPGVAGQRVSVFIIGNLISMTGDFFFGSTGK